MCECIVVLTNVQTTDYVHQVPLTRQGETIHFVCKLKFETSASACKTRKSNLYLFQKEGKCSSKIMYLQRTYLSHTNCTILCLKLLHETILNRVFQNFGGYGNQSFLRGTFRPDRRETLRIAKKLRFLLWLGLQRWP